MAKDTDTAPQKIDDCPVRNVLVSALGKWHILILYEVAQGPLRFNALRRAIGDVTQRVLT